MNSISALLVIIGALVALVNIIVQVLKQITWDKIPTNIVALLVSIILTLIAFFAWAAYVNLYIYWYYVAAAIVVGFMVAYAAMFGYDKLKETLLRIQNINKAGDE